MITRVESILLLSLLYRSIDTTKSGAKIAQTFAPLVWDAGMLRCSPLVRSLELL